MIKVSRRLSRPAAAAHRVLGPSSEPGQVRVVTVAEAADERAKLTALVAALFDRDGRLVGTGSRPPWTLARTPVVARCSPSPRRTAARGCRGRPRGGAGTVDYPLTAETVDVGR